MPPTPERRPAVKAPVEPVVTLLHRTAYGTLATHSAHLPGYPYASVVPYVVDELHCPVICISALAEHTKNLRADPKMSLSVLQTDASDVQAAPRLTLVGEAERFQPTPAFVARYLRHAPETEPLLALDFSFFRLRPNRIRYIGGLGKMGWIGAADWSALPALTPEKEAALLRELAGTPGNGVRLLGIDCFGIDYENGGQRRRQHFPDAPVTVKRLQDIAARMLAGLS